MRDIINATIDEKHFLKCSTYTIARNGEGLTPCLSIAIPDGLCGYWAYIDFKKPNGETFKTPRIDVNEGKIAYNIPCSVLDAEGELEVQVVFQNTDGEIWKTYVKEFAVRYSINATDDIPAKEDFITNAQTLVDEAVETAKSIEERANNGEFNGKDAVTDSTYSPISENALSGKGVKVAVDGTSRLKVWDGSIAKKFSGGDGTENNPYLISSPEELALMLENFGGGYYYLITCDLYLNDIFRSQWDNEWFCAKSVEGTIYTYNNRAGRTDTFKGFVDGGGYTVFGLYHSGAFEETTIHAVAFIPTMGNGYIKNLKIDCVDIKASNNVATFIGMTSRDAYKGGEVHIENCTVGENVNAKVTNGVGAVAGFIGYSAVYTVVIIKNCCCLSTNIGNGFDSFKENAFIGQSWTSQYKLINCYSIIQPINTNNESARLSAFPFDEAYQNVYSATKRAYKGNEINGGKYAFTKVTLDAITGVNALNSMPKLKNGFVNTTGYPEVKAVLRENAIKLISDVKASITNMDISVITHNQAGEIYVEPNTIYMLSSLNDGGCTHDSPPSISSVYKQKFMIITVGQMVGDTARCYAVELKSNKVALIGMDIPVVGNWPLNAIEKANNYTMRLTYDAGSTVIIIKNKPL